MVSRCKPLLAYLCILSAIVLPLAAQARLMAAPRSAATLGERSKIVMDEFCRANRLVLLTDLDIPSFSQCFAPDLTKFSSDTAPAYIP